MLEGLECWGLAEGPVAARINDLKEGEERRGELLLNRWNEKPPQGPQEDVNPSGGWQ